MRWLVTGCSTGVGRAIAGRLAEEGEQVVVTARRPETLTAFTGLDHVAVAPLDVRDPKQCEAAINLAIDRFGGLDVLVNNAGYGQFGAVEEVSDDQLRAQFETNLFGPWRLLKLALPQWRAQGRGHALFISSIAGSQPFPGLSAYTTSKFALEGLAESLAQETAHLGVRVTILQLGTFATEYGANMVRPADPVEAYLPVYGEMLAGLDDFKQIPGINDPVLAAEAVVRVARMTDPPLRVPVGIEGPAEPDHDYF